MAPADLDREVQRFAEIIIGRSPAAITLGKATFYRQLDRSLDGAYETASESMARNLSLEDAAEGMDAFLEKRKADWKGR